MLELNKEYTYSQICECLGWKQSAGNSKKAQIKEIERCFEWYRQINKKTHKEKKCKFVLFFLLFSCNVVFKRTTT